MSWSDRVFAYCERGTDPAFWAEPVNAISNAGFLVAAAWAARQAARTSTTLSRSPAERMAVGVLIGLVAAIGIGSFLFHTFATRWALVADVGPITAFMVAYLAFALRVFLGLGWLAIAAVLPLFLYAGSLAARLECAGQPCLNGTLGYAPALIALGIVGLAAKARGVPAGRLLLAAAAVFFVSAAFRAIDREVCTSVSLTGHALGTHAAWHILSAVTLALLLAAAIRGAPAPSA